jgi:hypothetical protein
MFGRNQVSDRDLLKTIQQRLARTGTASSSKVNVVVQQGNVTLTGTLQHAIQRDPIVKAVSRVAGVRRVSDLLQLVAKKRNADGHSLRAAEYKRVADALVDGEATAEPPAVIVSAEANDASAESNPPAAPPRTE